MESSPKSPALAHKGIVRIHRFFTFHLAVPRNDEDLEKGVA